ncbi:uncharacterized protein ACA1_128230 [Acanthamoeba castellanii str. Neff]|uniref:RRM domain-containing protein n=1 Tax=Acanthamoeba castellanii (strain ATCC 30010 / Neff) TaxID=1257118 RepID=L8GVI4_ACACF|nr:uncharacterized protein ACA1_128230 [Acanthamoeba castellanii str. Neff]ELR16957.1 hypothetical protein ACA1_128230 [Acanthamoeba castellanii str. Neff]
MLVLGKELMNLAATSSCTAIVGFFATKCGVVLNSHFSKLLDSRYAPWMLIEFVSASGLCKALMLSGTKHFNGKVISVVQAKSVEEWEAKVKACAADQCKRANRSTETQARQLHQAEQKAHNDSAIAEYAQRAEAVAVGFSPII